MTILIILALLALIPTGVFIFLRMQVTFIFTFIFILFLFFISGIYIIREGQQVVITQFGQIIGSPNTTAGLYLKIPFLWKAHYFNKRLMADEEYRASITTNDGYIISVDAVYIWKIDNAKLFINTVGTETAARRLLKNIVSGEIRQAISRVNLNESIRSEPRHKRIINQNDMTQYDMKHSFHGLNSKIKIGRIKLVQNVQKNVSNSVSLFGIKVPRIYIEDIKYENSVLKMIHNRMIQERLREAEKLRSRGRSQENLIMGQLDVEYNKEIAPATKLALQIVGAARAEETRIKALSYGQDADFYQFWRTLISYKNSLNKGAKNAILSTESQFLKLLSNSIADKKTKGTP